MYMYFLQFLWKIIFGVTCILGNYFVPLTFTNAKGILFNYLFFTIMYAKIILVQDFCPRKPEVDFNLIFLLFGLNA